MCIGAPMRVVRTDGGTALCEGRGKQEQIDVRLLGEPGAGTWVLAYRGSAVRALTEEEAAQTNAALDALEAVLSGATDVDRFFADLVGREPQLPPHLKSGGA